MNVKEYIEKMKKVEEKLLDFLDQEDHAEENYENFITILKDQQILTNKYDLKIILYMINAISNDHYRFPNFLKKIEQILQSFVKEIKEYYPSEDLFEIFKLNKRLLLFFFENKIILVDKNIYNIFMSSEYKNMNYPEYFLPEIKPFLKDEDLKPEKPQDFYFFDDYDDSDYNDDSKFYERIQKIMKEDFEKFNEKRKKGENEGELYKIIREDSIEEFIIYVNKKSYPLTSFVEESIFETNEFLLGLDKPKLIDYAAFYGSVQIFKYLYKNGAALSFNLWNYAIHGLDEEIFHILEEEYDKNNFISLNLTHVYNDLILDYLHESIKCHNNYITQYIESNLMVQNVNSNEICSYGFQNYNFAVIDSSISTNKILSYACKFDYYTIVDILIKTKQIDRNKMNISCIF